MPNHSETYQNVLNYYQRYLSEIEEGNISRAILPLKKAVEEASQLERPALLGVLLLKMGSFFLEKTGQIQFAVHAFTAGGMLLKDDPDYRRDMNKAMRNLQGMRKGYRGSSEGVPDIYILDTIENLERAEKDPLLHVKLMVNAGNCYLEMGQEDPALKYFQEARKADSITQIPFILAKVQTNEAELWRRRGDYDQADQLLAQARDAFEKSDQASETKEFYAILAKLREQQGKHEEALLHYEKALESYAPTNDFKGFGRTLTRVAQLYLESNHISQAKKYFQQALAQSEKAEDSNNRTFAHRGMALCFLQEKNSEKVIEHLEACIRNIDAVLATLHTEQGKLSRIDSMEGAMNILLDNYLALLGIQTRPGQLEYKILQKIDQFHGLILDDILQGVIRSNEITETTSLDESGLGLSDFQNQNMMIKQAAADYTPFRNRIVRRPKRDQVKPLVRLVYHLTDTNLIMVIDRPGEKPLVERKAIPLSQLRKKVKVLLRSLHTGQPARGFRGILSFDRPSRERSSYSTLIQELYQWLIKPIEQFLPERGSLLVVEPHDVLHLLPFSALQDVEGMDFGEKYVLLLSPSQGALEALRSYPPYHLDMKTIQALVVGNPTMKTSIKVNHKTYSQFSPLEGAEREAAFIQQRFTMGPVTYLKNEEANADAIREAAQKSSLIHLATHGLADEQEPMFSFLLVSGGKGYITAREIRNWHLKADLVVLSACETALGRLANTEGVIGLARALLIAGARTIVVSLWPVHDEATADLMQYFYQAFFSGEAAPKALQTAQLALKQHPAYAAPVYWAGFVVVGAA